MFLRKSPSQTALADNLADQELQSTFTQLAQCYPNAAMKKVLEIAAQKKSVIVLSADVDTADDLLALLKKVGGSVCVVKLHIDTIKHFSQDTLNEVLKLASELNFVLMHDSKFTDIGNTVKKQYLYANHEVAKWAPLVTAQAISGPGVLAGLQAGAKEAGTENTNGVILLAQMSSEGALTDDNYAARAIAMAEANMGIVAGIVTQNKHSKYFFSFSPGVNGLAQAAKGDGLGQQYRTAKDVIAGGSHFLIIGRGIMNATDPAAEAEAYQKEAWSVLREEQHIAALRTKIQLFNPEHAVQP